MFFSFFQDLAQQLAQQPSLILKILEKVKKLETNFAPKFRFFNLCDAGIYRLLGHTASYSTIWVQTTQKIFFASPI